MENDKTHKLIELRMGIKRTQTDCLPRGSGRGYGRKELVKVWNELGYKVGAEIGVRKGKFSAHICRCIPGVHLYCIDPWLPYAHRKYKKTTQDNYWKITVDALKDYNCTILRKKSLDAIKDFEDNSLDFVFIDGDHTFDHVVMDLVCWAKKVRSGGIVSLHDYYHFNWSGVVESVRAYTHCHKIDPWYVTKELEPTAYWVKP